MAKRESKSPRKKTEKAVRRPDKRPTARPTDPGEDAPRLLRQILDCMGEGVVVVNKDGAFRLFNPAAERIIGFGAVDAPPEDWPETYGAFLADTVTPVPAEEQPIVRATRGEKVSQMEMFIRNAEIPDGRFISVLGTPLLDEEGNVEGGIAVVRDISDWKQLQGELNGLNRELEERVQERTAALRESEQWFSTTLASIGDGVIATDSQGQVRFVNPRAQSLTGWSQDEAMGRPLHDVLRVENEETGEPIESPVERVIREGAVVGLANHTVLVARDGTRLFIDDSAAPIRDCDGRTTIGVVLVFHDVTQQRLAGLELKRLTARLLEMQEEERRQVAYDIHDGLGQLLTAASLHMEAFAGRRRPAQQSDVEEELGKARRCLADAVVEMRRMVSDLGPLLLEELGLTGASERLLNEMAERAGWETEFEDETGSFRLDQMAETALMRIFQEALANVAKHAEANRVRVRFARENDELRMEVRDWGRGFDLERMSGPESGRHVGLLGMRERAAIIGGEIDIESAPGEGTTVRVSVPAAPDRAPVMGLTNGNKMADKIREDIGKVAKMVETGKTKREGGEGISVLIADDHPMVREGLRSMLSAGGIDVVGEAGSGSEAIERVEQLGPEVVLMDVRMPDMDGLAATEIIKDRFPETSVIVITSYESKDYLRRAIAAGAAGYLLKGMSRDRLIDAIRLVKGGGSLIDSRLLAEMLKEMGVEETRFQGAEGVLEALTPRERDVLQLLVRGLTNKEIAAEMHYSMGTVKNVVQRVIEKLGVSDRTQAAVYAVRAGINPSQQA